MQENSIMNFTDGHDLSLTIFMTTGFDPKIFGQKPYKNIVWNWEVIYAAVHNNEPIILNDISGRRILEISTMNTV